MIAGTLLVATGVASERFMLERWAVTSGLRSIVLDSAGSAPEALPTKEAVLVFDESSGLAPCDVCGVASSCRIPGIAILGPGSKWTPEAILAAGCVDFLRRPFASDDAFARIHRALRAGPALNTEPASEIATVGELAIHTLTRNVTFRGGRVTLRRAECDVLLHLARNYPNRVTQSEIVETVLKSHGDGSSARNQIWELRKKLSTLGLAKAIETLRGSSAYRLSLPDAAPRDI